MKSVTLWTKILLSGLLGWISLPVSAGYTLGLVEWLPWGTAYVAVEKGFWQAEGIEIEVRQFADYETENLKSFEYGKTDFLMSMLGNVVEMINQNPDRYAIIYENNWSHGGDYFIVRKDLPDLAALKGKKIGLYSRSAPIGFFAGKVLATANLDVKTVRFIEIVNTADLNQAFKRGKLDGIISYDPDASKVVKDGTGKLLFTSADFPGVIPEGISVRKKILRDKPADVKKFLRGWLQAVKWQSQAENKAEFYAILKRTMFKNSNYSDADLKGFYAGGKFHTDLTEIKARNRAGIETYLKELLVYLEKQGGKIKSHHPADYLQTDLAISEAEQVFGK